MKSLKFTILITLFTVFCNTVSAGDCPKGPLPVSSDLHRALTHAEKEMEKGHNQKALHLLADYTRKNASDTHPQLPFLKGLIQYGLKRFNDSESSFKETVKRDPCFGEAWQNLAVVYNRQNRPAEAAEAMEKAFTLIKPENPALQYQAALLHVHAGSAHKALPLLKDLTSGPKPKGEWFEALSHVYASLSQPTNAAKSMEKAIRLKPDSARKYRAACLWIKADQPQKALPLLKEICATKKPHSQWRASLAHVLESLGKNDEAAKEKKPADVFRSALLHLKNDDPKKALPLLQTLSMKPNPNAQ